MVHANNLASRLRTDSAASADAAIRPKLLRRPAQFTVTPPQVADSPSAHALSEDVKLADPTPNSPLAATTATGTWQDDLLFGVVMVILVVAVNLFLILGLPRPQVVPSAPGTASAPVQQQSVVAPHTPAPLTLYSKPQLPPAQDGWSTPEDLMDTVPIAPRPAIIGANSGPHQ